MINKLDLFFLWLYQDKNNLLAKCISFLVDPKFHLIFWATLTFYILCKKKQNLLDSKILYFFLQTLIIMFVCGILKITFGRARPYLIEENIVGFFYFTIKEGYLSFPSSHSSIAISFIISLRKFFNINLLFYLFPITVGFCRLLLMQHFATDVFTGFLIGAFVAYFLPIFFNFAIKKTKRHENAS
jgi:undecaprenyl-diphosphatase